MTQPTDRRDIPGWGADLDPANRPAYPKEKFPPQGTGAHWDTPEPQRSNVLVFHSIERPSVTPVYGTSCPPRGLSGKLRKFAYQFSEATLTHWLTLLVADRIDVVEGLLDDLTHGHIPNVFSEMGLRAEFKHHPSALPRRSSQVAAAVVGSLGALLAVRALRR